MQFLWIVFSICFFLFFFISFFPFVQHHVHESRADDTGRDGNHGNADRTDQTAEQASQRGDGVDVAVTHRGESHNGPPESVADVGKRFRLCIPFDIIHQDAREAEHDAAGRIGGHQFLAHGLKHFTNQAERARIADQFEDDQNIGQYHQMQMR